MHIIALENHLFLLAIFVGNRMLIWVVRAQEVGWATCDLHNHRSRAIKVMQGLKDYQCKPLGPRLWDTDSVRYATNVKHQCNILQLPSIVWKLSIYQRVVQPFNRQIIQSEFSLTWSCVSLTRSTTSSEWKLFRFDKMEVNFFSNIADWCHILSLTSLKGGTWCANKKMKTRIYATPAVKGLKI